MDSTNHTLSPEAAVFVPRYVPDAPFLPLQQIPSYMTNCYPFVQGEFERARAPWNRYPRPPRHGYHNSPKFPRNFSGSPGNRMSCPQNFVPLPTYATVLPPQDNQWPSLGPTAQPQEKPSMPNLMSPLLMEEQPVHLDQGSENTLQHNNKAHRKKHSKDTTVWDFNGNHGNKKGNNQETHVVSNTNHEDHINKDKIGYHGNTISESYANSNDLGRMSLDNKPTSNHGNLKIDGDIGSKKEWGLDSVKITERSAGDVKGKKRQRRRSNSGKNSGSGLENALSKNSGVSVTRRDISCQTDFPEHISELSLAQYASELYKGEQLYRAGTCQGDCDSSDNGMDSDSGYNSPLHKKTQVSNGYNFPSLNSQAGSVKMKPVFSLSQEQEQNYSNNNSNNRERVNDKIPTINDPLSIFDKVVDGAQSAAPQKMSYAFMAQKKPSPVIYENKNQPMREENAKAPPTKLLNNKSGTKKERSKEKGDLKRAKRLLGGASDGEPLSAKENDKQSQVSGLSENSQNESKNATGETTEGKKKRRRNRKRRKKKKTDTSADAESDGEDENNPSHQVELHFEDEEEFPDLSCNTVPGRVDVMPLHDSVPLSYSAMLKQKKSPQPVNFTVPLDAQTRIQDETTGVPEAASTADPLSEVRGVRRRRKRHEMVEKAAEEELAEINLEQQMLRELNLQQKQKVNGKDSVAQQPGILKVTPKPQPSGKKSKQGIALDLSAMIIALEKKVPETPQKTQEPAVKKKTDTKTKEQQKPGSKHNFLDSTAPVRRGKERENPKPKKPSSLKKVILKEREEKKKMRLLDDSETPNDGVSLGIGMVSGIESDLSQDALSSKSSIDYGCLGTPASNDLSPISQTSPISMSPLSSGISPQSSEINSPIAGTIEKEVRMKIHSRRFREYCNQVLNKDIDNCCTSLLQDLVRFQDRMYHKDPVKAKSKRRLVLGLREVTKHLKLKKIKCVVVSPNLEKIQSKGGLDDALNNILNLCNEQNVPFVFALGRRALGRACAKLVPVSVVGIFNYDGSDDNFRQLMDLTEEARQAYKEMVSVIEKEINDYPRLGAAAAVPHIYAHMGHSRTPSGASVLSFTSSILSEPISENYPHSEPETDSKGYEIVKDGDKNMNPGGHLKNSSMTEVLKSQMKIIYPHVNVDIDDGNEADTEECNERTRSSEGRYHGSDDNESEGSDNLSQPGSDTIKALPHIDSIHSSTYDLNAEILSQHSGKNVDNCDTISTHSSRTLGDGSSTILADPGERSKHDTPKSTESPSSTLQRGKVIDAERIQNWVDQTQSRLEDLQYLQENTEESSGSESDTGEEETADDLNLSNGNVSELKGKKDGAAAQATEKEKVNSEAGKNSVPESGNGKLPEASDNTNCNGQNSSESNSGDVGCSGAIDNVIGPDSHNISLQTEENKVSDKNIEDENPSGSDITNDNMQNVPPS